MYIVNLTPHALKIGESTFPPSGTVARVTADYRGLGAVNGIPIVAQTFGDVQGLPAPQADTAYIVSAIVFAALAGARSDVYAPDTGPTAIRNDAGQIVGVTRLIGVAT